MRKRTLTKFSQPGKSLTPHYKVVNGDGHQQYYGKTNFVQYDGGVTDSGLIGVFFIEHVVDRKDDVEVCAINDSSECHITTHTYHSVLMFPGRDLSSYAQVNLNLPDKHKYHRNVEAGNKNGL